MQTDDQDHYELQNYTSISQGKHFIKFGGRLRVVHDNNISGAGFNGGYTFASLADYQAAYDALTAGMTQTAGAVKFNLESPPTPGAPVPTVTVDEVDAGLYVQDDWKVRPNLTLSGGLRFETQNELTIIGLGSRIGFAWASAAAERPHRNRLRGGFGLFYRPVHIGLSPQCRPFERHHPAALLCPVHSRAQP